MTINGLRVGGLFGRLSDVLTAMRWNVSSSSARRLLDIGLETIRETHQLLYQKPGPCLLCPRIKNTYRHVADFSFSPSLAHQYFFLSPLHGICGRSASDGG